MAKRIKRKCSYHVVDDYGQHHGRATTQLKAQALARKVATRSRNNVATFKVERRCARKLGGARPKTVFKCEYTKGKTLCKKVG